VVVFSIVLLIRIRFASATKQKSGCGLIGAKGLLFHFFFFFNFIKLLGGYVLPLQ
jgi:hypothetical protein